jgi:hypothetical protein
MAYKKRGASTDADIAQNRIEGIKQFDPTFDLGNGLNLVEYQKLLDDVREGLKAYNTLLSNADGIGTKLDNDEHALAFMNTRSLNGVGSKFGFDSVEYERAGGTRNSEIKRGGHKSSPQTPTK